jgi:hypothetical protein
MLFQAWSWPGIADGTITVTIRRWRRRQAVAGHRYRTGGGIIEVDTVDVVDVGAITDADARRAGYADAPTLVRDLRGTDDLPVYRVSFHAVREPDPRATLAAAADLSDADVDLLDQRLARLDRAAAHGPWTLAVLEAIAAHPATRAATLAESFGRETQPFKIDVRKLKNLGLTLSLETGYHLSPRGEAYLERRRDRQR